MIFPLATYPLGEIETASDTPVSVSGSIALTGSAAAAVRVAGSSGQTFSVTGAATAQGGQVEQGSLLGFGPLMAGAIGEMFAASTPITTITGAASGTFSISGTASGVLPIIGRAPDIVLAQWQITPTDGGAVIGSAPIPPTLPAWGVTIAPPGFSIIDYPNYTSQVPSVPFFGVTLVSQGASGISVTASGAFSILGQSSGIARAGGVVSGLMSVSGAGSGAVRVSGGASATLSLTGQSVAVIGSVPINGAVFADFDVAGVSDGIAVVSGSLSQIFDVSLAASTATEIFGVASGNLDVFVSSAITQPSKRRVASARQSMNGGRVLSSQNSSVLEV